MGKCHITNVTHHSHTPGCHNIMSHNGSHEECGKIVYRPCSSCISSVQEINENSIEFSLSTWTWRMIKSSRLSCYN